MVLSRASRASLLILLCGLAQAQPASSPTSEVPMGDYLALLEQIAPAARAGADAYLRAYEQHCRRPLTSAALRRAMSEGSGDPVLMGMIRASELRDASGVADLARRVDCRRQP
ncbi:MAG: hypothetical protein HZC37_25575 [Burkholderiales bacterium]|nr:hypothetical protein [Burkholderiales bacterium]